MRRAFTITLSLPKGTDSSTMARNLYDLVNQVGFWSAEELKASVTYEANGHRMMIEQEAPSGTSKGVRRNRQRKV